MYGSDALCGVLWGTFEIPHGISYQYTEIYGLHTPLKFWELSDFRAHMRFLNAQGPVSVTDI